jgi:hypothetical protein
VLDRPGLHGDQVIEFVAPVRRGGQPEPAARRDLLDRVLERGGRNVVAFGAVLALNGVYTRHLVVKWQSHLISELDVMPERFAERLSLLATGETAQAMREAETLLADTVQLVKARTDADISSFCEELSQRRRAIDPPSAEHRSAAQ